MVSGTCRFYPAKRYKCAEKGSEKVAKMPSASLRNGSQNGATLVGLAQVIGTRVVKGKGAKFDANEGANRVACGTYLRSWRTTNQRLLRREPTKGTY